MPSAVFPIVRYLALAEAAAELRVTQRRLLTELSAKRGPSAARLRWRKSRGLLREDRLAAWISEARR